MPNQKRRRGTEQGRTAASGTDQAAEILRALRRADDQELSLSPQGSRAEVGEDEIMVARFPNELSTDHGRSINQAEAGWPETLIGKPHQVYLVWKEHLQPLGYHLKAQIVDWPDGLPGDIALYISWKD